MVPATGNEDGVPDKSNSSDTPISSDTSDTESTEDGAHENNQEYNSGSHKDDHESGAGSSLKYVSGETANNQSGSRKESVHKSDDGTTGKYDVVKGRNRSASRKRTKSGRYTSDITLEEMQGYFHLPAYEAARRMGIGLTILKRLCRKFGVQRWPYQRKRFSDMKEEELLEHAQAHLRQQTAVAPTGQQEQQRPELHALVEQLLVMLGNQGARPYQPGYPMPPYQGEGQFPGSLPPHIAGLSGPSTASMAQAYFPPQGSHSDAVFSAVQPMDHAQMHSGSMQTQQSERTGTGNYLDAVQAYWKRQHDLQQEPGSAFRPFSDTRTTDRPMDISNAWLLSSSGRFGGTSEEEFKNRNFAAHCRKEDERQ